MATEPMTLFARIVDPAGVARRLRELAPAVRIDGPDDNWRNATVTLGRWWKKRTLTFTHDPAYYAEPNWSKQMAGMHNYFSGFRETERKERALMLTTTFRFTLGFLYSPDFDENDPRFEFIFAIAELLDGVLFTPSGLRDAHGRILFDAGGEEFEDPDAVWPQVIFQVSMSEPIGAAAHEISRPRAPDDEPEDADPPNPQRVARRALALTAVTDRAMMEVDWTKGEREVHQWYEDLLAWVQDIGIDDEFEPDEWKVLQRPVGKLDEGMKCDSAWRLEGLVVLAWALGRFQIPAADEIVEVGPLWQSLGWPDANASRELLANPTLKSRPEICTLRNRLFTLHWRLLNQRIHPGILDFAEFVRTCTWGPMDITGLELIDGDLALGGQRVDRVSQDLFSRSESAARERHQAVNWLWEGPARYSEARTDT
jgi:hypothetical protein